MPVNLRGFEGLLLNDIFGQTTFSVLLFQCKYKTVAVNSFKSFRSSIFLEKLDKTLLEYLALLKGIWLSPLHLSLLKFLSCVGLGSEEDYLCGQCKDLLLQPSATATVRV